MKGQDAVTVEIKIAAPPERVFRALTDQAEVAAWWGAEPSVELVSLEMSARRGGPWRYVSKPRPGHDHGDVGEQMRRRGATAFEAHGVVLESVPPRLLVWSWIANWHDDPSAETTVHGELEPTKAGTRVRVTHSGLAEMPLARKDYGAGWQGVLNSLKRFITERL